MAVLLVSRHFLASDFIDKHELPELLGAEKELSVVWIPVGPSNYAKTVVCEYQAAFDPGRTLAEMGEAEADRNLVQVSEKIVRAYQKHAGAEVTEKGAVELVWIPGGKFVMGSPETEIGRYGHENQREVVVDSFLLGRYPATNEQYGRFLEENPRIQTPEYWGDGRYNQPKQPVVGVSWNDAVAFAEWAGGRLPTEAEWEYACRAGTTTATYVGNLTSEHDDPILDSIAWYAGNSGEQLHVVGQKAPNAWGLHDMLGNVWEWCSDEAGSNRVLRGGSWLNQAWFVRAACRTWLTPGIRYDSLGLRLVRGQDVPGRPGRSPGAAERP